MSKRLTKEMLLEQGIEVKFIDEEPFVEIYHKSKVGCSDRYKLTKIKLSLNATYHIWSEKVNYYYLVAFSHKMKTCTYPLSRLIYAWVYGEVPEGMDVDHIDGNSLNNNLYNLQLLSRKDNLAKRKGNKSKYTTEKWLNK